jgi:hypothetical protein
MRGQLETGLAWLWLLCLGATLLDQYSPLQFTSRPVASAVHCGLWLLLLPALRQLPLPGWLPRLLWLGPPLLLIPYAILLMVAGVDPFKMGLLVDARRFFVGTEDNNTQRWSNAKVFFRRGRVLVLSQYEGLDGGGVQFRQARMMPLVPGLRWVREMPDEHLLEAGPQAPQYRGWTPVFRNYDEFSFDPAVQRQLDAQARQKAAEDAEAQRAWEASPYYQRPDKE